MKVLVVGAGFVGLTTACVLASRGIEVTLHESDYVKLSMVLKGKPAFYEPGLEILLTEALRSGRLNKNNWADEPDLTIIAVGTPSRDDGSIDTSYVELAVSECAKKLTDGSLVAIKSTVIPGTTRRLQNLIECENLELLMIPEFLREGTAVSDAISPDRNVIGSRSPEIALRAENVLGISSGSSIITSTFSAETIKYLSNAFLATCISFTNEIFASVNEDVDFDAESVISGWHADRRFAFNDSAVAGITNYLNPGPGFGGSCFPKDIHALNSMLTNSGKDSRIISAVIDTNRVIPELSANWISLQMPPGEEYVMLGIGFKDDTDDIRESPSLKLAAALANHAIDGLWHDLHVQEVPESCTLKKATNESVSLKQYFILMHHNDYYRELLRKRVEGLKPNEHITVFAMRYQEPITGINWVYPRRSKEKSNFHE